MSALPRPTAAPPDPLLTDAIGPRRGAEPSWRVRETLDRLWPYLRPYSRALIGAQVMVTLAVAINLCRPLLMGSIVHHVTQRELSLMWRDGLLLAATSLAAQLLTFGQLWWMQRVGARFVATLREALVRVLHRLRLSYLERTPIGDLVTRLVNDVEALGGVFPGALVGAAGDVLWIVGGLVCMALIDWKLALGVCAILPILGLGLTVLRRRALLNYGALREQLARLTGSVHANVSGITVIQAFGRESSMLKEFEGLNRTNHALASRAWGYEAFRDSLVEWTGTLTVIAVLWWSYFESANGEGASFEVAVAFVQYLRQLLEPAHSLAQRYTQLQGSFRSYQRSFQLLDEREVEPESAPIVALAAVGSTDEAPQHASDVALELRDVSFAYVPGTPVLQSVSLSLARGEKVALVGPTGSGKSTLTSLLLGFYTPTAGTIRVLGRDVQSYAPRELRRLFAVVPQEVRLFPGTLMSNICLADPSPDSERARAALEQVGALSLLERHPGGLSALIDQRGSNWSLGERQLIAFARAVYRDAPILLLDEATANLDTQTEREVRVALTQLLQQRTALVIAHRLTTVKSLDRIVVLQHGRVVESGTHEELLRNEGLFARLWRLQMANPAREASKAADGGV